MPTEAVIDMLAHCCSITLRLSRCFCHFTNYILFEQPKHLLAELAHIHMQVCNS